MLPSAVRLRLTSCCSECRLLGDGSTWPFCNLNPTLLVASNMGTQADGYGSRGHMAVAAPPTLRLSAARPLRPCDCLPRGPSDPPTVCCAAPPTL
eukprot:366127-Chlamydomonas_euryale.AAC.4